MASYTYDANGNKKSEILGNGVVSTYTYNKANRITKLENKLGNSTISSYEYSYFLDGSDACKVRNENGIIETTEYEYDSLKRLVDESVTTGNSADTYTYEYDDYGNRSKMTATGSENYVTEYNYNNAQGNYMALLQKEIKTVQSENNALNNNSNVKQTVYTYDANGNQITKTADGKTETNTYDGLNQLIGFTDGETTASYKYNVSGLRIEKVVNGQRINHVWDGSKQIVADIVEGDTYNANCYVRGTSLAAKYTFVNGAKSEYTYYTQNAHGDVVNLTNADGDVIKSYTYDAFGVEKNIDKNDTNAFRYCGEYFDTETGTIYLRARYYNPTTGRFISRDSVTGKNKDPLSLNLYTYCSNNPLFYVDPSGHIKCPKWLKNVGNWIDDRVDDVKEWGTEFVGDALTTGKEFVNAQNERWNVLWKNPSLTSFLDYMSYGYVSACNQRYQEADDLYGYANWALSGIPDMVKGAFAPEKPGSFDHVMNLLGVASLVTSTVVKCKNSSSKNVPKSQSYSSKTWGNLDKLNDHYNRHGADFNAVSAQHYAQMANDFFENRYNYLVKIDESGVIRVYDPYSNTFGSYNPNGTTKTFFKPTSKNYFNNQSGELIENVYDN